ncbi:MAG: nucleotidyltransferase family protein [Lachnospiraceae bacterium]|nr:nucleotidyltransferase family protein [Lachnospiraceae bacterium]
MQQAEPRIGCVVMAAGASKRFGKENKLLADLAGKPVLSHVLDMLREVSSLTRDVAVGPVCVVTSDERVASLARDKGFFALCASFPLQSDSVRAGVTHLLQKTNGPEDLRQSSVTPLQGILCIPGDQPLVRTASVLRLLKNYCNDPSVPCRMAAVGRDGAVTQGSPVIFPPAFYDALCALSGDRGGSVLLRDGRVHLTYVTDGAELYDVDTKESLSFLSGLVYDTFRKEIL